ncbi:DUF4845 domain-containing protein [Acidovorax sp. SUPP950]|uniref:DUF4845 domain-containing protein n=1 Tax=unclassified Acidovorax TaxID=2684926 RepID=UPI0023BB522C|nr:MULTISPECIES: DUF4845 domain-containing protein [Comamonadaceae]WOI47513.1 DUF4845 domain-containing protein [Paracidovorax avenae]GKS75676.1 DUF4845 domain-containing protein [Acidovorax sp. SUPP950]GKS82743.1 DUF4845 domain-containing protein [Acidovorax sp. SUPP1855]GKS90339.1 DUF4845 domain-containing protein [Acidovorax sp. SUPP2539]GKS94328.1 DUF4845 domain-containing protein [Acidovorax sp. SUPP2825]
MALHRTASRARQRGLSFIGLIFIGLLAVAAFAIGGQSVPIFLEYQAISKAANKAAREGSSVPDVRAIFDRAASIDNISSVQGKDLEVTKRNEKIVVSFSYSREIALAGPAYLVYRFQEQTK